MGARGTCQLGMYRYRFGTDARAAFHSASINGVEQLGLSAERFQRARARLRLRERAVEAWSPGIATEQDSEASIHAEPVVLLNASALWKVDLQPLKRVAVLSFGS